MSEPTEEPYTGIALDATAIRVLAHPLRSRVLGRLRVNGPATATELAEVLGTNTGATSYHLRKLESVGLVTDTGDGQGKRRLWRASTTYHTWNTSDFRSDEDASTALSWLERNYVRQLASRAEQWLDASSEWPDAWVDVLGLNDTFLDVTPAQLKALMAELETLLDRYRHAGTHDPAARRVQFYTYAHPSDVNAAPVNADPVNADPEGDREGSQ
jgi:DNA-binding transcriptional ArsR family regulator